jgi:hypothetical protein
MSKPVISTTQLPLRRFTKSGKPAAIRVARLGYLSLMQLHRQWLLSSLPWYCPIRQQSVMLYWGLQGNGTPPGNALMQKARPKEQFPPNQLSGYAVLTTENLFHRIKGIHPNPRKISSLMPPYSNLLERVGCTKTSATL